MAHNLSSDLYDRKITVLTKAISRLSHNVVFSSGEDQSGMVRYFEELKRQQFNTML